MRLIRGLFRWSIRSAVLLTFLVMLILNIGTFTVAAMATAVSTLLGTFGIESVVDISETRRQRSENAQLRSDLDQSERRAAAASLETDDLRQRNQALSADLDRSERRAATALVDADLMRAERRTAQEMTETLRGQTGAITRRIRNRTAEAATANVTATFGEAIPFYGIAIVIAATGYELWAACETMTDMRDLNLALGLTEEDDSDVTRVCGLQVPTRAEIWQAIRNSPSAVWSSATGALQRSGDAISSWDMPEIPTPDFGGWWEWALSWWLDAEEPAE